MESNVMPAVVNESPGCDLITFDCRDSVAAPETKMYDSFVFVPPERIEMIDIDTINTASPFKDLFPVSPRLVKMLAWNMKRHGFEFGHPLILWKENMTVVDGHARLFAAKKKKISRIPVVLKEFKDEDDAVEYALEAQRNRRNSSDAEILKCIESLGKEKGDIIKQKLAKAGINLAAPREAAEISPCAKEVEVIATN
jgi:hypothetical protein